MLTAETVISFFMLIAPQKLEARSSNGPGGEKIKRMVQPWLTHRRHPGGSLSSNNSATQSWADLIRASTFRLETDGRVKHCHDD
jgi:hypothetical protein